MVTLWEPQISFITVFTKASKYTLPWLLIRYATHHVIIRRLFLGRSWLWRVPSCDQHIMTSTWLHHYVNSQFEPLINVETQVSPNCVMMILTVRQQRSEFCYLQDDRNVFGYRPKVALSKTNLMTSVVNWQRVIRRRLRTPPSLINLSKPSSYLPYHQF